MLSDEFIDISFRTANMDRYQIRLAIFTALKQVAIKMKGHILDIGCGKMPYKKFLLAQTNITNYKGLDIPNSLPYPEVVLKAIYRVLKPNGLFFFTVPYLWNLPQMLGLWVRRSPISSGKRIILSNLLLPVIKYLIKHDVNPEKNFKEGQMITG